MAEALLMACSGSIRTASSEENYAAFRAGELKNLKSYTKGPITVAALSKA
jgi:hypothetical protein